MVAVVADNTTQDPRSVVMVQVGTGIIGSEILTTVGEGTLSTLKGKDLIKLLDVDAIVLLEIEVFDMSLLLRRTKGGRHRSPALPLAMAPRSHCQRTS